MSAPRKQRLSKSQERRLAIRRKGRVRPGSGSGPMKEDVADRVALGQAKYTEEDSIGLKFTDLQKVFVHAASENRMPYMELLFRRRNPLDNLRVYVVFEGEFKRYFPS